MPLITIGKYALHQAYKHPFQLNITNIPFLYIVSHTNNAKQEMLQNKANIFFNMVSKPLINMENMPCS